MEARLDSPIVIVDGGEAGIALSEALRGYDAHGIHIRTRPHNESGGRHAAHDGTGLDRGYLGSPADAAAVLAPLQPRMIVAGSPEAMGYADAMAAECGLPRWHRDGMAPHATPGEALALVESAGVRVGRMLRVDNPEEAIAWLAEHGGWPVAVRPDSWSAPPLAAICRNGNELRQAMAAAPGAKDTTHYMLQVETDGPEFLAYAMARDGRFCISEAWHVARRPTGTRMEVDTLALLSPSVPLARTVLAHVLASLDASGMANGTALVAIRLTRSGPILTDIQFGRLAPHREVSAYHAAGIDEQAICHARLLTGASGGAFGDDARGLYTFERHLAKVYLDCPQRGIVRSDDGLARLASLYTYHAHKGALRQGCIATPRAGIVYLASDCRDTLRQDVGKLRDWERKGMLYVIDAAQDSPMSGAAFAAGGFMPAASMA